MTNKHEEQLKKDWADFLKSRCHCRQDRYHQEACSECPKEDEVLKFWLKKMAAKEQALVKTLERMKKPTSKDMADPVFYQIAGGNEILDTIITTLTQGDTK